MSTPDVKPLTSTEAVLRLHAACWDLIAAASDSVRLHQRAARSRFRRDLKLLEAAEHRSRILRPTEETR